MRACVRSELARRARTEEERQGVGHVGLVTVVRYACRSLRCTAVTFEFGRDETLLSRSVDCRKCGKERMREAERFLADAHLNEQSKVIRLQRVEVVDQIAREPLGTIIGELRGVGVAGNVQMKAVGKPIFLPVGQADERKG